MEMTTAFTDVLHVANLTTGAHLMSILTQSDAFSKVQPLLLYTLFLILIFLHVKCIIRRESVSVLHPC